MMVTSVLPGYQVLLSFVTVHVSVRQWEPLANDHLLFVLPGTSTSLILRNYIGRTDNGMFDNFRNTNVSQTTVVHVH